MVVVIIPPTMGAAMGFITSELTPVSHRMLIRLARTTQTVMSFGRNRWTAPSITAASISSCFSDAQGRDCLVRKMRLNLRLKGHGVGRSQGLRESIGDQPVTMRCWSL